MDTLRLNKPAASPTGPVSRATAPVGPTAASTTPVAADLAPVPPLGRDALVPLTPATPETPHDLPVDAQEFDRGLQRADARYKKAAAELHHNAPDETPPTILRTPYTGGTPALAAEQMDAAIIKNNLVLRGLYALPERFGFALKGYSQFTRFAGPLGATAFFALNIKNTYTYLKDPKTPKFIKGSMAAATGLSGVTAAIATRMALHVTHVLPLAGGDAALKTLGSVAGKAGLGAGVLLSAIDTFQTFKDPKSTAGEKAFSLLGTGSSLGLLGLMAIGATGPVGIVLGLTCLAAPFLKGWLGKNKAVNAVCGTVGHAISTAGRSVGHFFSHL